MWSRTFTSMGWPGLFHLGDAPRHDGADALVQRPPLIGGQAGARGLRMDAGSKKDLVRVGIADCAEGGLVHEKDPRLVPPALDQRLEPLQRELGREDVDSLLA